MVREALAEAGFKLKRFELIKVDPMEFVSCEYYCTSMHFFFFFTASFVLFFAVLVM